MNYQIKMNDLTMPAVYRNIASADLGITDILASIAPYARIRLYKAMLEQTCTIAFPGKIMRIDDDGEVSDFLACNIDATADKDREPEKYYELYFKFNSVEKKLVMYSNFGENVSVIKFDVCKVA